MDQPAVFIFYILSFYQIHGKPPHIILIVADDLVREFERLLVDILIASLRDGTMSAFTAPTRSRLRTSTLWPTVGSSCRTTTLTPSAPPAEVPSCLAVTPYIQVETSHFSVLRPPVAWWLSGDVDCAGLQDNVLVGAAPYSLSPDLTLLPQYLNTLGYQSHAVGKAGSNKITTRAESDQCNVSKRQPQDFIFPPSVAPW